MDVCGGETARALGAMEAVGTNRALTSPVVGISQATRPVEEPWVAWAARAEEGWEAAGVACVAETGGGMWPVGAVGVEGDGVGERSYHCGRCLTESRHTWAVQGANSPKHEAGYPSVCMLLAKVLKHLVLAGAAPTLAHWDVAAHEKFLLLVATCMASMPPLKAHKDTISCEK